ncbi:hypothetical protein QJV03_13575 [Listeria swaminathanii]|uniref:tRNA_anti-like n=1 Tax=Listeria swaminathanii TaxID=2713501 RepID=A0A7X1A300_9LIST|nr:hypothetical protein [Listeria swaminathanii]MCD2249303.1 OB-fold putative lipoprotein [Listeria marthii]MBC2331036.1 hypothetical protein [Listeria swaminathanii]MDT0018211.1 hypothetical protein [Listeria swaminathanii]MDT0023692.1 hypothetical protein [Listeria swaminathanii]MDT0034633.1 hypothetical protein [Listeria swaminathanii]
MKKKKIYGITLLTLVLVVVIAFTVYQHATNNINDKAKDTSNQIKTTSQDEVASANTENNNTSDSNQSNKTTKEIVQAKDLLEAYKNNPAKKEPTSNGENITVNGVITYIGQDSHGTPSINLSDKANGEGYVLCVFGSFDELEAFSLGQEVTISANFHIMGSDGMVVLKQSEVL